MASREWWIYSTGKQTYARHTCPALAYDRAIHVIEKSSYNALQAQLQIAKDALRSVLELILRQDRTRDYPTGSEWMVIVDNAKSVLKLATQDAEK